ncbi:MAG TPA: hypothetical protein VKQ34_01195 [Candidatus Saccharimonadales bacterium]|nr:hypothetical protein [Candidatus Saccharimonadales bacterium]
MSTQLQTLLHKEMTRKEFLATLGLGVAAVLGLGTVLRLLTGKSLSNHIPRGYGSSAYGN